MTSRERDEYRALRATIRTRGTTRIVLFVTGVTAWAAIMLAVVAVGASPAAALVPLLILAAVFEAVRSLHVGVERIGRYLQVFHDDRWERTALAFGVPVAGTRTDPLFVALFGGATFLNFMPVALADTDGVEILTLGAVHAAFVARMLVARHGAKRQRTADFERFRHLETAGPSGSDPAIAP
jgi:hypothetical protein